MYGDSARLRRSWQKGVLWVQNLAKGGRQFLARVYSSALGAPGDVLIGADEEDSVRSNAAKAAPVSIRVGEVSPKRLLIMPRDYAPRSCKLLLRPAIMQAPTGEDIVDQVRRHLHHAPRVARWAYSAALARERYQEVVATTRPGKAVGQDPTLEVAA